MKTILHISLIAIGLCFFSSQLSFAVCVESPINTYTCNTNPPNPDPTGIQQPGNFNDIIVNVLPGAEVDTSFGNGGNGGPGIRTATGEDKVDVDNGEVTGELDAINTSSNPDEVTVKDSRVTSITTDAINTSSGNDIVTIINSVITAALDGIDTSANEDIVTVIDSTVTGQVGINTSTRMDQVMVTNSIISGDIDAIRTSLDDDTITLGTGADIRGNIDCGSNFDTMIFSMEVPEERLTFFSNQIALASVPDGSITIDGLTYEWTDCELLVNELVGVRITKPIPTLGQWGLIATAGILGIAGFMVLRKRKVSA